MYYFSVLFSVPMLAVTVAGLVLIHRRRRSLPPRSAQLGMIGFGALLASTVIQMVWQLSFVALVRLDTSAFALASTVQGLITLVLSATGVGLLLAAVLARSAPWRAAEPYPAPQPPFIQ